MSALIALMLWTLPVAADPVRIATFNTELSRKGPGLLLRDILKGEDPQIRAVIDQMVAIRPDIIALQGIDYDFGNHAVRALADALAANGLTLPHVFSARPNAGMATGLDMDGDGRTGRARDAQGYGRFAGQGGMAVLSRFPIATDEVADLSGLLWKDLPDASPPMIDGARFPNERIFAQQRLSTVAHWIVPIGLPRNRTVHLLTWHSTPPVFDGPEDRNGHRNHDETMIWLRYLEGALDLAPATGPLVFAGDANLDPVDGDGRNGAIRALLNHPRLGDPAPTSQGAVAATLADGGANAIHIGDPALDTADWRDTDGQPGNMRVDYVLPSTDWRVLGSGVFWPADTDADTVAMFGEDGNAASRHRIVWVDVMLPD